MKNHTRLPLLVTAAVFALTACTPVADSRARCRTHHHAGNHR